MPDKEQQIEDLQRELALTRVEFSTRLQRIEQKISAINAGDKVTVNSPRQQSEVNQTKITTSSEPEQHQSSSPVTPSQTHYQLAAFDKYKNAIKKDTASKPSFVTTFLHHSGALLLSVLSPLTKFISPLLNLYQHYQAKGQGPIFVFMLIGIALLVGGFGYLAQLLIDELGAGSKSLMLFVVAIGITYGGAYLAKADKYPEISSAIVSLGLLLNFMTVYVAGSYYQLLPDWLVLCSYLLIACSGFILANKFDAKIVSALAVIGGGAIPLISQLDQLGTSYYLFGLGFLLLVSLYQATSKNWQWLGFISVFVAFSCLEFLILNINATELIGFFSQGFYCVFLLYICTVLNKQSRYSKEVILLTVITLFANVGIFYQASFSNEWIFPILAVFNALLSGFLLRQAKIRKSYTLSLHTMMASTWVIVAILSSLDPDYWGFAIGLEGLFILYFALKDNYFSLRIEAYGLLAFAILHAIFAVLPYFPSPALLTIKGIAVVASIGVFIFCTRTLFKRFSVDNRWEVKYSQLLRPSESIWLSLFVLSLIWVQWGVWGALAILPLQVVLLFKSYRTFCHTSEILAYVAGAAILAICILGINQVQSLSFRELPNYAKVALILGFVECWLFAEFYRRMQRVGFLANLAEDLRLAFYLILPLAFLPSVLKHYVEFSALAIWCSAIIAYLLGRIIKHPFIRSEALVIFVCAAVYNLGFIMLNYRTLPLHCSFSSLFALGLFSYFLYIATVRHIALLDKKIASLSLYFIAGCLATFSADWINVYIAGALTSGYMFVLVLFSHYHSTLIRNQKMLGYLCFTSLFVSWLCIAFTSSYHIISSSLWVTLSLVISLTFLVKPTPLDNLALTLFNNSRTGYTLQHSMLAISGMFLLETWQLALLISPWLILQGSYLFFIHKHNTFVSKLALGFIFLGLLKLGLVDAANALLWQKVALMIGIGMFMLAAAFTYQKRLSTNMQNS